MFVYGKIKQKAAEKKNYVIITIDYKKVIFITEYTKISHSTNYSTQHTQNKFKLNVFEINYK